MAFVHPTSIIDEGVKIGEGTKIWHFCHICSGAELGLGCNLGQNVYVASGVVLGNGVKVQNNVSIYSGVVCQNDVFLGPSVVFTNVLIPRSAINRQGQYVATLIEQGASIGANATIVCGIIIGRYALVGAGAVVTKSIAPYSLVVGNPARHVGWVSEFGHKLTFDPENKAQCPESKQNYELTAKKQVKRID